MILGLMFIHALPANGASLSRILTRRNAQDRRKMPVKESGGKQMGLMDAFLVRAYAVNRH